MRRLTCHFLLSLIDFKAIKSPLKANQLQMRQINRLLLLVSVGFILAKGFVLQDGENSTEIEKGVFDLKAAEAER